MSKAAAVQEPTMEEILASIRRIVSDDEPEALTVEDDNVLDLTPDMREPANDEADDMAAEPDEDEDVVEMSDIPCDDAPAAPRPATMPAQGATAGDLMSAGASKAVTSALRKPHPPRHVAERAHARRHRHRDDAAHAAGVAGRQPAAARRASRQGRDPAHLARAVRLFPARRLTSRANGAFSALDPERASQGTATRAVLSRCARRRARAMLDKTFDPRDHRAADHSALGRGRGLQGDAPGAGRGRALVHRHPATERDRRAPHGARARRHASGHPRALPSHDGQGRALAAGHGPCRHRDADGGRTAARRAGLERHAAADLGRETFVEAGLAAGSPSPAA